MINVPIHISIFRLLASMGPAKVSSTPLDPTIQGDMFFYGLEKM